MRKDKRFAKKLLFAVLAVMILVSIAVMGIGNASALADTKRVYFTSNGYWDKFFAVYAWDDNFDNGEWYTLTAVSGEEDLYSADIASEYNNIIFCSRSKLAYNWDYVVDKTDALTIPENSNHLTMAGKNTAVWSNYLENGKELVYFVPCEEWMNIQYTSGHRFALHAYSADDTDGVWLSMDQVKGSFGVYPAVFAVEVDRDYDEFEFCRVELINSDGAFMVWEKTYSQTKSADCNMFTQSAEGKDGNWSHTEYIEPEIPEETEPDVTPTEPKPSEPSVKPEETKTVFFTANETWKETVSLSIGRISAYAWSSETSEGSWYWLETSAVKEAEYSVEIDAKYDSILFGISYSGEPDGIWGETESLVIPEDSNHFVQDADDETIGTWQNIEYDNSNYYYVTFVNEDGAFISSQVVKEGAAAVAPENPTREADAQFTYKFVGWDTDFSRITSDTTVTALFTKTVNKYTVTFTDFDGTVIDTQEVEYGKGAAAPADPTRTGYNFKGWDTSFDTVTGNITVKAQYSKIVEAVSTGTLRVEIAGGTNFRISIDGGAQRPQGTSYMNSKAPIGVNVTVTANSTNSNDFLGWMNDRGLILTTDLSYTFVTTGGDYLKAMYQTDIPEATLVIFKNDKANQILDMQYYVAGDEIVFPEYPQNSAYLATGWTLSAEEIAAKVAAGESVVITPTWERILVYVNVKVSGGTAVGLKDGKSLKFAGVTATAAKAPAGEKFAYWVDQDGNVLSYQSTFTFYPATDMEITAVYVQETEEVEKDVILNFVMDTSAEAVDTNPLILSWEVTESDTVKFVQAGALLVDSSKYNADTFVKGTADTNVTKWTPGSSNQKPVNTVTANKKGVANGTTWYGMAWITVEINGKQETFYTDLLVFEKL